MDTNDDDDREVYDFGWWPEIFGAVALAALIWFLFTFARGTW